jgi:cell division protein FtsZ
MEPLTFGEVVMTQFELVSNDKFLVSVVGIGGCGCNAVNMLNQLGLGEHAQLVAVNTDTAALNHCEIDHKILIGENLTNGYGAGADPAVGLEAARESRSHLIDALQAANFVILVTGLGGGTGTGATPFVAELVQEISKPCICIATLPFESEGQMRMDYALDGLSKLRAGDNALITLPNERLITALGESVGLFSAFKHSNEMLQSIIRSLVTLLTETGLINVDFNDFSNVMNHTGDAILGVGRAETEDVALDAVEMAISNPMAQCGELSTAKGVILQINCREEPSMATYNALTKRVRDDSDKKTLILVGVAQVPDMESALEILLIATGVEAAGPMAIADGKRETEYLGDDPVLDIPTFLRNQKAL